jgi:hypothetical protein
MWVGEYICMCDKYNIKYTIKLLNAGWFCSFVLVRDGIRQTAIIYFNSATRAKHRAEGKLKTTRLTHFKTGKIFNISEKCLLFHGGLWIFLLFFVDDEGIYQC